MIGFLKTWKAWLAGGLLAVACAAVYSYGEYKEGAGEKKCQDAQAHAQASYWEQRSERLAEEGKEALKEEKRTSGVIAKLQDRKKEEVKRESEKPVDGACLYTDDEWLQLEALIHEAGGA